MSYRAALGATTGVWLLLAVGPTAKAGGGVAEHACDATLHDVYFADAGRGWAVATMSANRRSIKS